jgi:hypothetical protein
MVVGPILALLAIVGVVAIFIWIVQLFVRVLHLMRDYERDHSPEAAVAGESALDILERRFAVGEIDSAEFEEKHKLLAFGAGARQSAIRSDRGNARLIVPGSGAIDDRATIAGEVEQAESAGGLSA